MTIELELFKHKIYVTGATGWVGRTFLHELQSIIPSKEFNKTVIAFGSKANTIMSTNYRRHDNILIPIRPLSRLKNHSGEKDILIFHSAFLTKDKISSYGLNAFVETNQYITNTISSFIEKCSSSRVVSISSGAASNSERRDQTSSAMTNDPYGYLKLAEEKQLSKITKTQVFRIYGLTGRFIRDPRIFALGDLLIRAITKKPLIIKSSFPVIRSYVSASDVAKCAIYWLLSSDDPQLPVGASSHVTTLIALAELIAKLYSLPPPTVKPLTDAPNSYSCSPICFSGMLANYGINPLTLAGQIRDTAHGLKLNCI